MTPSKLTVQGLQKTYGRRTVVSDVSIDVSSGEVVSALGATPIFVDIDEETYNIDD